MRISKLVTCTLRDDPPEAETASHRLMLRAGLIQQVAAGVYARQPMIAKPSCYNTATLRTEVVRWPA